MKNLLFILLTIALVSCNVSTEKDYTPEFKEQKLKGKIGGKDWESKIGKITFSQRDSVTNWSFNFSDLRDDAYPCNFPNYEIGKIIFSSNNIDKGIKQLYFGLDFSKNQTVTLVYKQDSTSGPMNKIAVKGAYEVLEVDTTVNNLVKGRMDVYIDDNNWINGNFTATYCPN